MAVPFDVSFYMLTINDFYFEVQLFSIVKLY